MSESRVFCVFFQPLHWVIVTITLLLSAWGSQLEKSCFLSFSSFLVAHDRSVSPVVVASGKYIMPGSRNLGHYFLV